MPSSFAPISSAELPPPKKSDTIGSNPPAAIELPAAFVPPAYDHVRSVASESDPSVKLKRSISLACARFPVKEKLAASADTLLAARTVAAMAAFSSGFMHVLLAKSRPTRLRPWRGRSGTCAAGRRYENPIPRLSQGTWAPIRVLLLCFSWCLLKPDARDGSALRALQATAVRNDSVRLVASAHDGDKALFRAKTRHGRARKRYESRQSGASGSPRGERSRERLFEFRWIRRVDRRDMPGNTRDGWIRVTQRSDV